MGVHRLPHVHHGLKAVVPVWSRQSGDLKTKDLNRRTYYGIEERVEKG